MRAYHQIPVESPKTAVMTPFGLLEFARMPFVLRNAGQSFQHFMDQVLRGLDICFGCIDDLLLASSSPEEHVRHLRLVLQSLAEHGLTIDPSKCIFSVPSLDVLGHFVSSEGIRPIEDKVQAIHNPPTARVHWPGELLSLFLAFVCSHHASAQPAADKSAHIEWTEEALSAFSKTKEVLADATLLTHPKLNTPMCLMRDASDNAVGAVLQQYIGSSWQPIAFFSKKMKPAETLYSTFDRELLAIYTCHFLEGRSFPILIDHKPLIYALNTHSDRHSPHQARHLDNIAPLHSSHLTFAM